MGGAHRAGMNDVHAGHAPEGLMDPADSWDTLGTHVVAAKGARGACLAGCLSVIMSAPIHKLHFERKAAQLAACRS